MQRIAAVRRHLAEADPRATTDPTTPLAIGSAAKHDEEYHRPRASSGATARAHSEDKPQPPQGDDDLRDRHEADD